MCVHIWGNRVNTESHNTFYIIIVKSILNIFFLSLLDSIRNQYFLEFHTRKEYHTLTLQIHLECQSNSHNNCIFQKVQI